MAKLFSELKLVTDNLLSSYSTIHIRNSRYDGPYKVIKRADKQFTVDVRSKHNVISLTASSLRVWKHQWLLFANHH